MVTFLKTIVNRMPDIRGQWLSGNGTRLYSALLPTPRDTRRGQSERTTSTSPFVALDGRSIDHEEERVVRL